jgi:hypothetical protein
MFEGLFPDADRLNLEEMQLGLNAQQAHLREKDCVFFECVK